jgi:cytochrome P450
MMTQSTRGDPFSAAAKRDPYSFYAQLRAAQPVCCLTLPSGRHRWLITHYDDAERALRDPRLIKAGFSDDLPAEIRPLTKHMLNSDPPGHTRLRTLVRKAFSPRLVEAARHHFSDDCRGARNHRQSHWQRNAGPVCPSSPAPHADARP